MTTPTTLPVRHVGDVAVSAIGLGAMPLSAEGHPDEATAIGVVHAALDAGIRLVDTADAYAVGRGDVNRGEDLVARAVRSWDGDSDAVLIATKGGHTRTADDGWGLDGSAGHLRRACEASLRALGVDAIGLYQHHRPDPAVPYEETLGALRDLRDDGLVRMVGLSNASVEQIRLAVDVLGEGGLASVQNEFSPRFRTSLPELHLCAELGVAFLPWSPLGGAAEAGSLGREHSAFAQVAEERGVSPQQVALAWELAQAPVVIPIPGSSRAETARASAEAARLELTADEVRRLDEG